MPQLPSRISAFKEACVHKTRRLQIEPAAVARDLCAESEHRGAHPRGTFGRATLCSPRVVSSASATDRGSACACPGHTCATRVSTYKLMLLLVSHSYMKLLTVTIHAIFSTPFNVHIYKKQRTKNSRVLFHGY